MAVQTRSQLNTKAATIASETAPSANTAARVGGLFDDISDSVVLSPERGLVTLIVDSTQSGVGIVDTTPSMLEPSYTTGTNYGDVFSTGDYTITYQSIIPSVVRVSFQMSFTGVNNRWYRFWIAVDGNEIPQSVWDDTLQGTHIHTASCEAYVNANESSQFSIYALTNDASLVGITIRTLTFSAYVL